MESSKDLRQWNADGERIPLDIGGQSGTAFGIDAEDARKFWRGYNAPR